MRVPFGSLLVLICACSTVSSPRSAGHQASEEVAALAFDGRARRVDVTDRHGARGPRALVVIAHPDDETAFAGTLYKWTTHLDGVVDVLVLTNGEGGFKYATLAERIYGVELTDESIGRAHLPAIRQHELVEATRVLGVQSVTFLAERDHRYTTDLDEVLGADARVWDLERVRRELAAALQRERYDCVFALRPTPTTHAHHQAATRLAREAVLSLEPARRPALLIGNMTAASDAPIAGDGAALPAPEFSFDRLQRFGFQEKLDYRIVVNWEIAEHKSQGTMQLALGRGEREEFALWGGESDETRAKVRELFARLAEPQFEAKTYGASAGTNAGSTQ
ncbi:MAG: PIG-L family deacetylase [Planctomycetes bacterium]|nr:PIG-L family deacetylase [Planctomycetota bacterium]